MASEILNEIRYNYVYKIALSDFDNMLDNNELQISQEYKNAYAAAYSEAYIKSNWGNNNLRYQYATDTELINWTLGRFYLKVCRLGGNPTEINRQAA